VTLNEKQEALCAGNTTDFSGLSAVILNCTLKRPEEASHTDLLLSVPAEIMRRVGVTWGSKRKTRPLFVSLSSVRSTVERTLGSPAGRKPITGISSAEASSVSAS
jgi:hypothetical protein